MKKILGTEAECPVCWSIRCTHHLSWMLKDGCEFTGQQEILTTLCTLREQERVPASSLAWLECQWIRDWRIQGQQNKQGREHGGFYCMSRNIPVGNGEPRVPDQKVEDPDFDAHFTN